MDNDPERVERQFADWIARFEELAIEGAIALPLDLSLFRGHYAAGQTPSEALENYVMHHGAY